MPEQADQTDDDGEAQQDESGTHHGLHPSPGHEHTRSDQTDHCRFDDFAMI